MAVALGVGAGLAVLPSSWLEHEAPSAAVAIEAPKALVGLAIAALCWAQFRRRREAWTLVLGSTAAITGALGVVFAIVPDLVDLGEGRAVVSARGTSLLLFTIGLCTTAALLVTSHRIVLRTRDELRRWACAWGAILAVAALAHHLIDRVGGGSLTALRLFEAACLTATAIFLGFVVNRNAGPACSWLAVGAALAAGARLHAALVPPGGPGWLTSSHVLTAGSRAVILAGIVAMFLNDRGRATDAALAGERRRIARELHDGLASLALIKGQARWLATREPDNTAALADLAEAAEHALEETRRVVKGLDLRERRPPAEATEPDDSIQLIGAD